MTTDRLATVPPPFPPAAVGVAFVRTCPDVMSRTWGEVRREEFAAGTTVAGLAARVAAGMKWKSAADELVIIHNGRPLKADQARGTVLRDRDDLRLSPRPRDPATWVLIGIAILSAALSAFLSTRVRAPSPTGSNDPEGRRYVFNRFSNDAIAGDPIPVVLGRVLGHGGKVIAKVPVDGPDGDSRVKLLIALGHGPFNRIGSRTADGDQLAHDAVTGIRLQDQPLASYPGCRVSVRMGTPDQAPIPGFDDIEVVREVGVGGTVLRNTDGSDRTAGTASAEAVTFATLDAVDRVVVRVRFPRGLYTVSESGQTNPRRVRYRVRVRTSDIGAGAGAWSAWETVVLERSEQSDVVSAFRPAALGGAPARLDVQAERITAEAVTVGTVDEMFFDSVTEVRDAEQNFPGIALLAVELVASEQLTTVPRVSADVEGFAQCRVWDRVSPADAPVFDLAYSNNPADLALTWLTNETWGLGGTYGGLLSPPDAAALDGLFAWAAYCDEQVDRDPGIGGTRPRFACNLQISEQRDGIDWLRTICRTGRCTPATVGGSWRFIYDRPQATPVEVFTEATIAADDSGDADFTLTRELTTGGVTRPNRLTAQIRNDLQNGRDDLVVFPEYGTLWLATEVVREQSMKFEGVTDPEQVHAELVYMLKRIRALGRTVRLVTTKPIPAVQPGERFDVACDMPGWGLASGRLLPGSTASALRLDRPVTLEGGDTYTIRIVQLDGTILDGELKKAGTGGVFFPVGTAIDTKAALPAAPDTYAEYSLGRTGAVLKPFLCTRVTPIDSGTLRWQVEGLEYAESVYDPEPLNLSVPNPSVLTGIVTPPGPLASLAASERTVGDRRQVELSWTQRPGDVENTATFRVYRRVVGTESWVAVPEPRVSRRAYVIDLVDVDRAYQFVVVAVSAAGTQLSPYDPRHPVADVVYGLAALPPAPPTGLDADITGGNLYTLVWDPVDGAVAYQVLTGGEPGTGLPNDGAEDCLVVARTIDPELAGLRLMPGEAHHFWVRSVGPSGRLSFEASPVTVSAPDYPSGESNKDDADYDLTSDGTNTNLSDLGGGVMAATDPGIDAVFLGPEEDPGSLTLSRLMVRVLTANRAEDPALEDMDMAVPSIAADQWGVVDDSPDFVVGMLMPPWPDNEQTWLVEARTHDGVMWSDWETVAVGGQVARIFQKWQVRVTLRRTHYPYRPALVGVAVVVSD